MDTIIYAVIAVIVLSRLWSVLGRRNDEDSERQNPFVMPEKAETPAHDDEQRRAELPPMLRPLRAAPDSLAGGLEQIKALDPAFDEKQFLAGARTAFTMIVSSLFKSDITTVHLFLSPGVRAHFEKAISDWHQAGQVIDHTLVKIRDAESTLARVDNKIASITVRFVSEQTNVIRDSSGKVTGGSEGVVEEIIDFWTFTRDTSSTDPNWVLAETKS